MSIESSAQTSKTSPQSWQKPSSRIKLKVKKRKLSIGSYSRCNLEKPLMVLQNGGGRTKRINPFACETESKKRSSRITHTADNKLFKALENKAEGNPSFSATDRDDKQNCRENISIDTAVEEAEQTHTDVLASKQEALIFPVDWSLKTKIRFTSDVSFSWASSLKSVDMAASVTSFVRCLDIENNISSSSLLHCASKVWIHPSLPWLQLFPRQPSMKKCHDEITSVLQSDWTSSFHSLFNLLRCGNCPYFYLCTGQSCMLFMAPGLDREMVAVVTPTTKGFRDALQREGIDFSLPHSKTLDSNKSTSDSDEENEYKENQADNDKWLESVGLAKEQFPSLEKYTKQQETQIRNSDQQPASTVMVMGGNTLALSNFILNWKSVMSGIPPTLLAPVAFEGAVLRSHKISQGIVKHQDNKNMKQIFSLEIIGPILPGCLQRICHLLQTRHKGPFTATLTSYQCTIPLNVTSDCDLSSIQTNAGMTDSELEYFSITNQQLDKTCLKEIKYSAGLYRWK